MKKLMLAICFAAVAPLVAADAASGAMNPAERALLIEELEKSKKAFLDSIAGVTAEQWKFKSAPNVWSVAECSDHIILTEGFLFGMSQDLLKAPAVARPATSSVEQDRKLMAVVENRSKKAKAPEPIVPSGKFDTPAAAAKAFTEARDKTIAYAKSTNDDLRTHVSPGGPAGPMDAYQALLLMATHTGRHTAQILEVEGNSNYPKAVAKEQFLVLYALNGVKLESMNEEQKATMGKHVAYLQSQFNKGVITWGGRLTDPANPRGVVLVEVANRNAAETYLKSDPGVKGGVLVGNVEPFTEFIRATR